MELTEQPVKSGFAFSKIQPWIVCFAASLFFFYEFIQGNMFASIADNIMQEFNIQAQQMTYLSSIYYIANVIFLFFAGMMLDRRSAKKTMLIAMLLCVTSTFILANTHSFYLALLCRFVTGIGSAFCFLGPIRIASRWFPAQRMALVTGCIVTTAMTGGMMAQYPLTKIVAVFGWRESLTLVAWLGVAMLIIMAAAIKDKPGSEPEKRTTKEPLFNAAKQAYFNSQAFRAAAYTSLMNMGIAVFGALIGTLYLMQRLGISKEEAAIVNSLLFLGTIIGGPLIGWFSDRIGLRVIPMKLGAIASLATVLSIMYLPVSLPVMKVLFFLLGFFTSSQIISYALVAESSPPAMTATAVSLISILTQAGYVLYQNLFSGLLVKYGEMHLVHNVPTYSLHSYQSATVIIPLGLILALMLIMRLQETYCHRVKG